MARTESAEEHPEETPSAAGTGSLQTLTVDVRHVCKEAEGPRLDGAGDKDLFLSEMLVMGIRIPFRLVSLCSAHESQQRSIRRRPPAPLGQGLSKRSPLTCAMSARKRKAPDSMEQGLLCSFQHCFVCGESGATIACQETGCDRSFHLPCAVEGGCVTQFFPQYRSFCWEHRPEQAVGAAPEENTTCLICLDLVEDRTSYGTMVCPACQHAWFHRGCIQGQAVSAGFSCFRCPLCRDKDLFLSEMLVMGIRIPFRLPSWENSRAYTALNERHRRCDARECLCPGGREQAEEEGPWQLLLCCSCAAEGTHRRCSYWRNSTASWECDSCAGLGTGKRQSSRVPLGWGQGPESAEEHPEETPSAAGTGSLQTLTVDVRHVCKEAEGPRLHGAG
ncbi:E3 ubiquitin-protein ligase PHF7-like [Pelecanus crispus]|uniref:E3 ubiquitin-protein ligase PHF7-like n=2 Tax=Pelecanus crispus TaxID=36300 RepID=UPI003F5D4815